MFNTIILLHGDAALSKMEMKKFKKETPLSMIGQTQRKSKDGK